MTPGVFMPGVAKKKKPVSGSLENKHVQEAFNTGEHWMRKPVVVNGWVAGPHFVVRKPLDFQDEHRETTVTFPRDVETIKKQVASLVNASWWPFMNSRVKLDWKTKHHKKCSARYVIKEGEPIGEVSFAVVKLFRKTGAEEYAYAEPAEDDKLPGILYGFNKHKVLVCLTRVWSINHETEEEEDETA